ncbi:hypothetical protein [Micromonospora tarensis]|uniref:Uncharacterized protein n=1 Tax=Micromonospora tarensis TaxID=2806100 RepID=A0ABS1YCK9_9ACTN|nr:hypothetical protein [Micromonospora tarensis]MBM0275138.1 hypothetical protein [Micromonospora tarensis]
MSLIHDLAEGAMYLGPIAVGVGLLYHLGRDRSDAAEYDLWAPHDEPSTELAPRPDVPAHVVVEPERARPHAPAATWQAANPSLGHRIRPAAALTGPVGLAAWQPDPVRWDGPTPPIARALRVAHAVPTLSDAAVRGIAHDYLREIADEEWAKAGIRPIVSPAGDRDLTGAFAVVA